MKAHPEGGKAGDCFVNGETCSIWMWDPVCREWTDTNRPLQSPLAGMIIDAATFCPSVHPGVRCVYLFVSGTGGRDIRVSLFPQRRYSVEGGAVGAVSGLVVLERRQLGGTGNPFGCRVV